MKKMRKTSKVILYCSLHEINTLKQIDAIDAGNCTIVARALFLDHINSIIMLLKSE